MAEREGFEPSVGISYARFPGVCLKPLSHLSTESGLNVQSGCERRNEFLGRAARMAPNRLVEFDGFSLFSVEWFSEEFH